MGIDKYMQEKKRKREGEVVVAMEEERKKQPRKPNQMERRDCQDK